MRGPWRESAYPDLNRGIHRFVERTCVPKPSLVEMWSAQPCSATAKTMNSKRAVRGHCRSLPSLLEPPPAAASEVVFARTLRGGAAQTGNEISSIDKAIAAARLGRNRISFSTYGLGSILSVERLIRTIVAAQALPNKIESGDVQEYGADEQLFEVFVARIIFTERRKSALIN